jgi:putative DNA primase/helicase
VLRGPANTGKSTLLQALLPVLGSDTTARYADMGDKKLFVEPRGDQHPAGLADALQHRLVLMSEEYGEKDKLNMPLLKAITGGDRLKARFMRQDFWTGTARCTPWLATNHDLRLGEFDESVRSRLRVIDVPHPIPPEARRLNVVDELREEAAGLLAWAVAGAVEFYRVGMADPERVRVAADELADEEDPVTRFLRDATEPAPVDQGASMTALYNAYLAWSAAEGYDHPLIRLTLGKRIAARLGVRATQLPRVRVDGEMSRLYPLRVVDEYAQPEWPPKI